MHKSYGFFEEDELGRLGDVVLWRRLGRYIRPHAAGVMAAVLLSLMVIATTLALPYLVRLAIDLYITNTALPTAARLQGLTRLALLFAVLLAAGFLANFRQVTILEQTGQSIMHRLRRHLFDRLLAQEQAFFDTTPAGKLVTRLTNDVQNMHEMFTSVIVTLFNDCLQMTAILAILYTLDRPLALFMTALVPVTAILTWLFSIKARDAFRDIRTRIAAVNAFLQEIFGAVYLVQGFGQVRAVLDDFRGKNRACRVSAMRQVTLFGFFLPLLEMLGSIAVVIIIEQGGQRVLSGEMTIGSLAAFLFYMRLFFKPVKEMSQKYSIVQSALASAERIFELIDRAPRRPAGGHLTVPKLRGAIEFRDVCFSYGDAPALDHLSLAIGEEQRIALVGATGSGKTTLVNLLERLYDPDSGEILVDGRPIAMYDTRWLRGQIGLVMQDIYLVSGTIRENICFGLDGELPAADIETVVRAARLEPLLANLPQGMETPVGDGGRELSTGEKQLLALARVLLRDPGLLILDEATAGIDPVTESLLTAAMDEAMSGRTAIIIAHRLTTIRRADRIVVLDRGMIAEQGTFAELAARRGLFARLLKEERVFEDLSCKPATPSASPRS